MLSTGPATAAFTPLNEANSGGTLLADGIIHLYRTNPDASVVDDYVEEGTMLAVLAIPSWMTISDFLTFTSSAMEGFVHIRIVRLVSVSLFPAITD
jgi:BRCA1-associated protein